jgi:hypothetical protein
MQRGREVSKGTPPQARFLEVGGVSVGGVASGITNPMTANGTCERGDFVENEGQRDFRLVVLDALLHGQTGSAALSQLAERPLTFSRLSVDTTWEGKAEREGDDEAEKTNVGKQKPNTPNADIGRHGADFEYIRKVDLEKKSIV